MSARLKLAAGLFGLLMLALLSSQVVLLLDQRRLIDRQTTIAEAQRDTVLNVLEGGRDLTGALEDRLPALRRTAGQAGALLDETRPLVQELGRFDAARALASAGALAAELAEGRRAVEAVDRVNALLREAATYDTLADIDATRGLTAESLRLQRTLLATQERALAILEESLAVQRETLVHARSIDRKTGPALP